MRIAKRDKEETEYPQNRIREIAVSDIVGIIGILFLSCFTLVPRCFCQKSAVKSHFLCVESVTGSLSPTIYDLGLKLGILVLPMGSTKWLILILCLLFVQVKTSRKHFEFFGQSVFLAFLWAIFRAKFYTKVDKV